ncbi:MAG: glycosyltransferase [Pseudomonadota bacterium]
MIVDLVNYSDSRGGAARAALRLHRALLKSATKSRLRVVEQQLDEAGIQGVTSSFSRATFRAKAKAGRVLVRALSSKGDDSASAAFFRSPLLRQLNRSDAEIVHLHWVNAETLSIEDIGKIQKPVVWTMHDMWAIAGARHYEEGTRWKNGYSDGSRFSLDRWVWGRKARNWGGIQVVAPSNWLAEMVRDSPLFGDLPVCVIPNAIDTNTWRPHCKVEAKKTLGIPSHDIPLISFVAMKGKHNRLKGSDLLGETLRILYQMGQEFELLVVGESRPASGGGWPVTAHYPGFLKDDELLNLAYSASDLLMIPSRQDNLPNTGVEALASGTPIACFDIGGMSDLVDDGRSGCIAKPFDCNELASKVRAMLEAGSGRKKQMAFAARSEAENRFSEPIVSAAHNDLYRSLLRKPD